LVARRIAPERIAPERIAPERMLKFAPWHAWIRCCNTGLSSGPVNNQPHILLNNAKQVNDQWDSNNKCKRQTIFFNLSNPSEHLRATLKPLGSSEYQDLALERQGKWLACFTNCTPVGGAFSLFKQYLSF
jgi:hypothetical protein